MRKRKEEHGTPEARSAERWSTTNGGAKRGRAERRRTGERKRGGRRTEYKHEERHERKEDKW